ncbi:MAG: hypothetical protein AAGJ28_03955 [Pseudomonadota bacterium]
MKIFRVLSVVLTCFAATNVSAGTAPEATDVVPAIETAPVSAVRAMLNRCLPAVASDEPLSEAGLVPTGAATAAHVLGGREGQVWTDRKAAFILVNFADTPSCRIIAPDIDLLVMGDLVTRLFTEADSPIARERFKINEDGTFSAVYTAQGAKAGVIMSISTGVAKAGAGFATLSVERMTPFTH